MIPTRYELLFSPDLDRGTFECRETISATFQRPTDTFTLDAVDLEIRRCDITTDGNRQTHSCTVTLNREDETMVVKIPKQVFGWCSIVIECSGILNDRLLGFYRSRYGDKYLATTQFEAADARRAFPCIDRPDAKAIFAISVRCRSDLDVVSNMPLEESHTAGGYTTHRFAETPIMSTYLVYLGVGNFEYLSDESGSTAIRVITTKGESGRSKYALDVARRLLAAYEEYFGIRYPLPKLDLLAIPDFAAGAMENWGAITFREPLLLYDPDNSSARTKQLITEVISHEIAHQWFGNLVTMRWWNDLWLNESFATFMATKFVDQLYPEFDMQSQFHGDVVDTAMKADALRSTHPIDAEVESPDQIREIFDAISYDKGASVLMMLEHYVGEQAFKKGLQQYLYTHRYGNAEGDDLWDSIGSVSDLPVKSMMHTWIRNSGFPVLEARSASSHTALRQSRFQYESRDADGVIWHIPVSIDVGDRTLMTESATSIDSTYEKLPQINPQRRGFYRVSYPEWDSAEYAAILERCSHPLDRWAIQNDLFAMCTAGRADIARYMELLPAYYDDGYPTTTDIVRNLTAICHIIYPYGTAYPIWNDIVSFLSRIRDRLGWQPKPQEPHTDRLLRGLVITSLGFVGDSMTHKTSAELLSRFAEGIEPLHPDIREPVYSTVSRGGGSTANDILCAMYSRTKIQEEGHRLLRALGHSADPGILRRNLDFALTDAVRSQDTHILIASVAANPSSKEIFWPWLSSMWPDIRRKIGSGNPLIARVISGMSPAIDPLREGEIREFFVKNHEPGIKQALEQALERARIRSNLTKSVRESYHIKAADLAAAKAEHSRRDNSIEEKVKELLLADSPKTLKETSGH